MRAGGITELKSIIILGIKLNIISIIGLLFYGISFLLWMYLVQKYNISKIVPLVLGISNTVTIFGAVALLGESVTITNWIGIGIIIVGVIIVNMQS